MVLMEMERDSVSSIGIGLEWEDLSVPKFEIPTSDDACCYFNGLYSKCLISGSVDSSSTMDGYGKLGPNCSSPCEPMTGLRLGRQREYVDTNSAISSMPAKRSRASFQSMQNPCCQVEGCNLDLKLAKDYHRRHRICETHSKSPNVIVAGMVRRFCQQCSRFHELSEFDDKKRSCRRRLSDHNARRRRVQPESISARPHPAIHEQRPNNILLNGLPITLSNSTSWEYANILRPSKVDWGLESAVCFSNDDVHNSISSMHMDSESRLSSMQSSPVLDQYLLSAHSLLSPNSWSLNEGESSSIEGLVVHDNYIRHTESDAQNLSFLGGEAPVMHSINMHKGSNSSHSEFQPFKAHYDSDAFYSTQRDL